MRKGGGKAKGAEFERSICKQLSLWISSNEREDVFWRSAMSGGRATVAGRKGKNLAAHAGDISSTDQIGHTFISRYYVECKFYRDLKFQGLLTATGPLTAFWLTAKCEADKYNKTPILIAKQNQYPTIVCIDHSGSQELLLRGREMLYCPPLDLRILLMDEFLKHAQFGG